MPARPRERGKWAYSINAKHMARLASLIDASKRGGESGARASEAATRRPGVG